MAADATLLSQIPSVQQESTRCHTMLALKWTNSALFIVWNDSKQMTTLASTWAIYVLETVQRQEPPEKGVCARVCV